jgi:predicted phage-related endonuclease
LEILPDLKVEEIVRAYYRQEKPKQIVELASLPQERIKQLALAFETIRRIQAEIDVWKQSIKDEMEKRNIESFKCDSFHISIRKEHIRTSFDSKKFKEDFPEIWEKYKTETKIKSSINIDYKGGESGRH